MKTNTFILWGLLLLLGKDQALADSILGTKHDLSAAGPGPIRAASESEICLFCHTPHRSLNEMPLWNHTLSSATYIPYSSSTTRATVGQPTGSSKLCLSCHDGTVAIGMVNSRPTPIAMQGGVTTLPIGDSRLGTDLADDHPVSFTYDSGLYNATLATPNGRLRDPAQLSSKVRLDHNQQLQCTSCHNAHDNQYGKFLAMNNTASALCIQCHDIATWSASSHATATKTWNNTDIDPWPHTTETTVANNACESCHAPHAAGTKPRLLNFANEEQNCFSCHNGNVASKNLVPEFAKASVHPITATSGVHDPTEDPLNPPRHVECADCHNPHATRNTTANAPNAPGSLAGVRGINSGGAVVEPLLREYELCFRCHADSAAKGPALVTRQYVMTNTRMEFNTANPSFHPVVGARNNTSVPSLLVPWTSSSIMYCGDCHNNNQGPGNGGTGPNGPHGSIYPPILERQLLLADNVAYNVQNFALCFKCHSSSVVVSEQSNSWQYHRKHIVEYRAACTTCHDSHASLNKPHLINFNTTYVQPYNGVLQYNSTGVNRGNCTLTCHDGSGQNKVHDAKSY